MQRVYLQITLTNGQVVLVDDSKLKNVRTVVMDYVPKEAIQILGDEDLDQLSTKSN